MRGPNPVGRFCPDPDLARMAEEFNRTNEWTQIPPRLYRKNDPALPPRFYAKWNVKNILEGVGKRPPDLDPGLPLSQVIKEVQRRAKIKMRA